MSGPDWQRLYSFEQALQRGARLKLDEDALTYLRKCAGELNMTFEEYPASVEQFVLEARRRVREGSRRLMYAIGAFHDGRLDEARARVDEILKVETVPLYLEQVRVLLKQMG